MGCRFGHADLSKIGNGSRTVWWKANTGSLDQLFYNPHHRHQVKNSLQCQKCSHKT